jgi:hypothetical protein
MGDDERLGPDRDVSGLRERRLARLVRFGAVPAESPGRVQDDRALLAGPCSPHRITRRGRGLSMNNRREIEVAVEEFQNGTFVKHTPRMR